jgi:hypothetical protein
MVEKFREEFDEAIEKGVPGFGTNGDAAGAEAKGRRARREAEHLTAAGRSR